MKPRATPPEATSAELRIERVAHTGEGIAVHNGRAVFVPLTWPGDRVEAKVSLSEKVLRGDVVRWIEKSPARREPSCALFGRCGGCDWLHVDDAAQRDAKRELVLSALERLGGIDAAALRVSERYLRSTFGNRRRATLQATREGLAFFERKSHQTQPVDECPALSKRLRTLPGLISKALGSLKGLRSVGMLEANDEASVVLEVRGRPKDVQREAAQRLVRALSLSGALVRGDDGSQPFEVGDVSIATAAPGTSGPKLFLRPDEFAQANEEGSDVLVEAVLEALRPGENQRVLELYSGHGLLTFPIAQRTMEIWAVESSHGALAQARRSAESATLKNVRFFEGDCPQWVKRFQKSGERFDALVLDPPRSGAPDVAAWAKSLGARRVVYVACDAAALGRDTKRLTGEGFVPEALHILDLFPQTRHVEAVLAFERQ
ncbi:MAG: class I SAM-dependent RNA methyltransferase [Myxococcaceae bacterium]